MKFDDDLSRIFYYHAAASPFGGHLTHPIQTVFQQHASTCVPQAGGHASARIEKINIHDMVRCEAAYSHTNGSVQKSTGNWTTLVTSVAEGINVFDIVTADRIVTNMAIEHHRQGYYPKVSFVGSQIENLRVNGRPVSAEVNTDLLNFNSRPQESEWTSREAIEQRTDQPLWIGFPDRPWPYVASFTTLAAEQSDKILGSDAPLSIKNRFRWVPDAQLRQVRGYVLCSLINDVQGAAPGSTFGHVIDVPNLGRLFLGELVVDPVAFRLTMMRIELGCVGDGDISFCTGSGNGLPMP